MIERHLPIFSPGLNVHEPNLFGHSVVREVEASLLRNSDQKIGSAYQRLSDNLCSLESKKWCTVAKRKPKTSHACTRTAIHLIFVDDCIL